MEIKYDMGINWCHFQITVNDSQNGKIALFRLHMDSNLCWNLISRESVISTEKFDTVKGNRVEDIPTEFEWLEKYLCLDKEKFCKTWCEYHGVSFYEF